MWWFYTDPTHTGMPLSRKHRAREQIRSLGETAGRGELSRVWGDHSLLVPLLGKSRAVHFRATG